ncbi:MAG TPA: EpsI family protein [Candidatus Omnitrophota bacterium]|nr:EpsI family protein [Candidatus Omnitrophota bacterium]
MRNRLLIATFLPLIAITLSYGFPKPKYESSEILKKIHIPKQFEGWESKDISHKIDRKSKQYNFIGDIIARVYRNKYGEELLFLALDAGNFHNPKVCYSSSGFKIIESENIQIKAGKRTINAQTLFAEKKKESFLLSYWLVIDKKPATWAQQKAIELWSSFINSKKAGFMIRVEVPTSKYGIKEAKKLIGQFFSEFLTQMDHKDAEYFFGTF